MSKKNEEYFTKFPNKTYDYLLQADLNYTQLKIILTVIRYTKGWKNREWCKLSLSDFATMTNTNRNQIARNLNMLIKAEYLIEKKEGQSRLLKFNETILNNCEL